MQVNNSYFFVHCSVNALYILQITTLIVANEAQKAI